MQISGLFSETAPHPSVLLLDRARPYSRVSAGNPATADNTLPRIHILEVGLCESRQPRAVSSRCDADHEKLLLRRCLTMTIVVSPAAPRMLENNTCNIN